MKKWVSIWLMMSLGTGLVGCSNMNSTGMDSSGTDSSKAYIGMFSGAIIGGLAASAIAEKGGGRLTATAIGTLVGGLVGGGLGMIMDEKDHMAANPKTSNNTVVQNAVYKSDSWQHAGTGVTEATTGTTTTSTTTSTPASTTTTTTTTKPAADATTINKTATPPKAMGLNDKLGSFWHSLPSTQWFFDDGKQAEVG